MPFSRSLLAAFGGLSALLACASCNAPWNAPTYFVFEDIDPEVQPRLKVAVGSYGYRPLESSELSELSLGERDFGFCLANVRSTSQLASAHESINEELRRASSPARLRRAEMRYAGVSVPAGAAGASLVAQGRSTPGSTVRIDGGSGELIVMRVMEDGLWSVSIPSSTELEGRGGWVYGEAEKEGARQYFRLNLLTGKQETIGFDELPNDSKLR